MAEAMRLDKWLWFARLAPSRNTARDLCESRHIRLDRRVVERASVQVRPGQILVVPNAEGVRVLKVLALPGRRGPFAEARLHYEEMPDPRRRDQSRPLTAGPASA